MKFGIIGSNFIVDEFLENAFKIDDFEFFSMYSRSMEKALMFKEKYGCKNCFDDMEEFLNSGIDCLYVASPILIHEDQVIKALDKKINVLCEKALTVGYDSFLRMKNAADRNGVLLMDAMVPVYTKSFSTINN